ncbi:MAG: bifunctional metallophosphatase/5'-nucleotidase, partial [Deltaproteobacteria bacterium]|nr:bifunctional metallophosphatase/5'-nucleotidase [Deltaproteobacteria bacterium]
MKLRRITVILLLTITFATPAISADKALTIIHTNDMHSHLLGAPPNIEYTPDRTADDHTIGGWARIATVIRDVKKNRQNPVLVLDAGDFLMGSLFHMLSREQAYELRLLDMMGYDMVTLGNHEFDLKPQGLARILTAARGHQQLPPIVFSNAVFSPESSEDDELESLFNQGLVQPYRVLVKNNMRIGFFGLMGKDAAEVAPFADPIRFSDPIATAQRMVAKLREAEKVDLVICLSHSGLSYDGDRSEDEILAKEVEGIDIIISGHTHTKTTGALQVNSTIIVQAWEYGKQVGILDISHNGDGVVLKKYDFIEIGDSITGDDKISNEIMRFEDQIDADFLTAEELAFRKIIAHTDFDLFLELDESNLGNLITDAIRWSIHHHEADSNNPVDVAVISNGVIRDPIVKGKTGNVAVCDAFRSIPLGIGFDEAETMGYPLITFYIYPSELKKAFEILTSIYPLKGSDYFLQASGVRFSYNPNRMIFDRITEIWLGDDASGYEKLDYSGSNHRLLRIAADIYNSTFLKIIGSFTWNILDIVPKDRNGNPIEDLKNARVD